MTLNSFGLQLGKFKDKQKSLCDKHHRDTLFKHIVLCITFLTCPLIPLTVRMAAPSNLAISKSDVNIPLIRAVFLYILHGVPVSLIFFTILAVLLNS